MIQNPYSVLGVSETASEEEIAKAYRNLVKKYHPDLHPGDKNAEKKMSEINAAYDQIKNGTASDYQDGSYGGYQGGSSYSGGSYGGAYNPFEGGYTGYSNSSSAGSPQLAHIRACVREGEYAYALQLLSEIRSRTAEWYYLSAIANSGVGNSLTALNHARQAAAMEPNNLEYRRVLTLLQHGGRMYQQQSTGYGAPCICPNGMCLWLCAAQLCCSSLANGCSLCLGGNAGRGPMGY